MLSRLLRKSRPVAAPTVPNGMRVYAIGDIHGRLDLLGEILARIGEDSAGSDLDIHCIFLGDVIDRGPESAGVVTRLMRGVSCADRTSFIMGNHEELLLHAARGERSALSTFARAGGRETMLSYGLTPHDYDALDLAGLADAINSLIPATHLAFLADFQDRLSIGDYRFVHAGVRPNLSFEEQRTSDLRWIRREFLEHRGSFDGVVVHGHTVSEEAELLPQRIGIDTGAYATGRLTALVLEGGEQRLIQTAGPAREVA